MLFSSGSKEIKTGRAGMLYRLAPIFLFVSSSCLVSCSTESNPGANDADAPENDAQQDGGEIPEQPFYSTAVMFDPSRSGHLFDAPFPNNDRLKDGRADFSGYPNTDPPSSVLKNYLKLANSVLDGFGCNSPVYFRFTNDIDESSLPAGEEESLSPGSSVFMVDVDRDSPEYGNRIPVSLEYNQEKLTFRPAFTLAVKPMWGFPLRPSTTYAVVITTSVRDKDGNAVGPDRPFWEMMNGISKDDKQLSPFREALAPLLKWADSEGIDVSSFAGASVFTTQDPVRELKVIRDYVYNNLPGPELIDVAFDSERTDFYIYKGHWNGTNFQHGDPPYSSSGGEFEFDDKGLPIPYKNEELRFSFIVPKGPQPASGWPVLIYSHGTGGSYTSVYSSSGNAPASLLAQRGIASFGIDQPLHGPRAPEGTNVDMWTFNFINPESGRTVFRQSAIDSIEALRFVRETLAVPSVISATGKEIRPDPDTVLYAGHSQGGMAGALVAAVEPGFKGFVLSGAAGGLAITILERKDPVDLEAAVRLVLGLPDEEKLTTFHPVLALIQTLVDVTDMINYAPFWHDISGPERPRNLLMTEGLLDDQSPPRAAEALIVAGRLPILEPVGRTIKGLDVLGIAPIARPASGNVENATGLSATEAASQYPNGNHWTIFDDPAAGRLYADFLLSLVHEDIGVLK
ncbi:MAG: hypothetical protein GXP49_06720 [Deltaproteobacteria bacterium]|nr:hypothetical protein [Deltaproteobacteria bacterium]